MQSRRILLLQGLGELEKLEDTGTTQGFKYVVERGKLFLGPRKPTVVQVKDAATPTTIVKSTTQFVAVCQLIGSEVAPAHLPRVRWAYL